MQVHTTANPLATAVSGTTAEGYMKSLRLRPILMTCRNTIHVAQPRGSVSVRAQNVPAFRVMHATEHTYRLRPILLRRIGWENTSSSLIRSTVFSSYTTALQNSDTLHSTFYLTATVRYQRSIWNCKLKDVCTRQAQDFK